MPAETVIVVEVSEDFLVISILTELLFFPPPSLLVTFPLVFVLALARDEYPNSLILLSYQEVIDVGESLLVNTNLSLESVLTELFGYLKSDRLVDDVLGLSVGLGVEDGFDVGCGVTSLGVSVGVRLTSGVVLGEGVADGASCIKLNIFDEGVCDCLPSKIPDTNRKTPAMRIKGFTIERSVNDLRKKCKLNRNLMNW